MRLVLRRFLPLGASSSSALSHAVGTQRAPVAGANGTNNPLGAPTFESCSAARHHGQDYLAEIVGTLGDGVLVGNACGNKTLGYFSEVGTA